MTLINVAILVEITCHFERKMPLGMFNSNGNILFGCSLLTLFRLT